MANSAGIILPQQTPANTTVPASGQVMLFSNQSATGPISPVPYWMDSTGAAHAFGTTEAVSSFTVYNVQDYSILPGTTTGLATTNSTNMATLISAAVTGSVIYFPSGQYQFASAIAVGTKSFIFQGNGGNNAQGTSTNFTLLQTTSATADLFTLTDGYWYTEFRDMNLSTTVTKSAGNMITCGTVTGAGNVGINIRRCSIGGIVAGTNIFNGIYYAGTSSGNVTYIEDCSFSNFANYAVEFIGNTSTPGTSCNAVIRNCTINGALSSGNAVAGIYVTQCGSLLIMGCDVISCATNLDLNPTTGTSSGCFSVYTDCCYFDQATTTSLSLSGTGNIQRCTFVNCWFTTAATASLSAVTINSTAATLPTGITFDSCSIYNTQAGATSTGVNITGLKDAKLTNCSVAGWATGIAVTSAGAAGTTSINIEDCTIGPTGGIAANTNAIVLNAGSFTYGSVLIQGNNLNGNTASLTDNSTAAVTKAILDNIGCAVTGPPIVAASAAINTTATILATANANAGLQIGTSFRITLLGTCTATVANASTFTVRFGTAGTTADGTIATAAFTSAATGTAIPFKVEIFLTVRTVGSGTSATCFGYAIAISQGAAGVATGLIAQNTEMIVLTATAFSSLINGIISIGYVSAATTTTSTFQNAYIEVVKA